MLSMQDDPNVKRRAYELGTSDHVVKLPDRIKLVVRIRAYSKAYAAHLKRVQEYQAMKELINALKGAVDREFRLLAASGTKGRTTHTQPG